MTPTIMLVLEIIGWFMIALFTTFIWFVFPFFIVHLLAAIAYISFVRLMWKRANRD